MANFYVTHHQFPSNPQLFTINLHKVAGIPVEENPNFNPSFGIAEEFWKIFIYTTGLDASGDSVGPVVLDVIGSEETVNSLVEKKLAELCDLIDWSQQGQYFPQEDNAAPRVVEQFPSVNQSSVPITSPVVLRVQDPLPGNGIDASTVVLKIDGHQVNPNVVGNKYDFVFSFSPRPVFDS